MGNSKKVKYHLFRFGDILGNDKKKRGKGLEWSVRKENRGG